MRPLTVELRAASSPMRCCASWLRRHEMCARWLWSCELHQTRHASLREPAAEPRDVRPLSVGLLDLGRDPASTETLPSRVWPGRWLRNAARCCAAVSAWRLLELPLLRDAARGRGLRAFIALRDVCVRRRVIFGAVSYITLPPRVRAARAALLHQLRAERGGRAEPSTSIATASGCPCPSEHVACSGPPTVKCRVSCVRAGWWCCGSGCAVCPLVPGLSGRCPQNMA